MEIQQNRRRWIREVLNPPEVGILYTGDCGAMPDPPGTPPPALFVDLLNRSLGGAIVRTKWRIEPEGQFWLLLHSAFEERWERLKVTAKWIHSDPHRPAYNVIGVEFTEKGAAADVPQEPSAPGEATCLPSDFDFFRHIPLFDAVDRDAVCALLNSMAFRQVRAGNRLLKQGSTTDDCCIIQSGTCTQIVETETGRQPIGRLHAGDVIGETAIVGDRTVETHVDAVTDLDLWILSRSRFDAICVDHPEMRRFLTALLTQRFRAAAHSSKRTIGDYRITGWVAEDSRSITYNGVHCRLKLPVTVKMIKHETALDPSFAGPFEREARAVAGFTHPGIVRTRAVIPRYRTVFMVTEHLEGESLQQLLDRWQRIPVPRAVNFLTQLCAGVAHAHRRGIAHRDLRPDKVMVLPGDRLKIVDFALAPTHVRPSALGVIAGDRYTAPELLEATPAGPLGDVYALGAMAYEMVAGAERPTVPASAAEAPEQAVPGVPDPGLSQPELPDMLRKFILKAAAADPQRRFSDAEQALQYLQPLARSYGLEPKSAEETGGGIASVTLVFEGKDREAVTRLLEDLSVKAGSVGAQIKVATVTDRNASLKTDNGSGGE
jgi:serine/threonine protein kinase